MLRNQGSTVPDTQILTFKSITQLYQLLLYIETYLSKLNLFNCDWGLIKIYRTIIVKLIDFQLNNQVTDWDVDLKEAVSIKSSA